MTIIDIKKDKKHQARVLLSDERELLLDLDVFSEAQLFKGKEISEEEINEILHLSQYKRAKSRALWYLERMDHTEKALYEKLIKAGFSKKISAEVMQKLTEFNLVDDVRYAERYAARLLESNVSKREAYRKMMQRGIPQDIIKATLEENEVSEEEQIRALLEGKYAYKLTLEGGEKKVFDALVRKGFSFSAVRSVLKEYIEDLPFSEEY